MKLTGYPKVGREAWVEVAVADGPAILNARGRARAARCSRVTHKAIQALIDADPMGLERLRSLPIRQLGPPIGVATPLAFLCSVTSRQVTGQVIMVDGGFDVRPEPGARAS